MKLLFVFGLSVFAMNMFAQQAPLPPGAQSPDAPPPNPASPQAKSGIAPALAAAEDKIDARAYDAARPLVLSYIEQHPQDPRARFDLGYIEDSTGQGEQAAQDYRRAIALESKQFESHAALGLLLAQEGKTDEARNELKTAGTLEPASHDPSAKAQVWRTLAQLALPVDATEAKDDLLRALHLMGNQSTPADLLLTAQIAETSDDAATAEIAYRRLLAAQPGSSAAAAGLAHLLMQQKKYSEAEPLLRNALKQSPDDATLNAQLASVLTQEGHPEEAITILERLHHLDPNNAAVSRILIDAYQQGGAPDRAAPLLQAALQQSPNDADLLTDYGQSLIYAKRFSEAVPVFQHATAVAPGNADAWSGLAFASSQLHQDSMTLQALEARSKISPDTPAVLFLRATAYDNLHQSKKAADYYRQFLASAHGKFPDEEWQARHRLVALGGAH
jgi:tetratricopeptide (TPR) repeat protein